MKCTSSELTAWHAVETHQNKCRASAKKSPVTFARGLAHFRLYCRVLPWEVFGRLQKKAL